MTNISIPITVDSITITMISTETAPPKVAAGYLPAAPATIYTQNHQTMITLLRQGHTQ